LDKKCSFSLQISHFSQTHYVIEFLGPNMLYTIAKISFLLAVWISATTVLAESERTPLTNEEAILFIKGKDLNSTRMAGGSPYLQFKEDGTMYGSNSGYSDSGKWRVEDGKLCMTWRKWEYEGCGQLERVDGKVQQLYPDGKSVHLIFK
jgi:hypothetical protein